MKLFLPVRRATILVPSGPDADPDKKHLFVILTNPAGDPAEVAMVSIQSVVKGSAPDYGCLLYSGDHPFIVRESFVAYRHGRIVEAGKLLRGVKDGALAAREPFEEAIFARVLHGINSSRFISPDFRDYCVNPGQCS